MKQYMSHTMPSIKTPEDAFFRYLYFVFNPKLENNRAIKGINIDDSLGTIYWELEEFKDVYFYITPCWEGDNDHVDVQIINDSGLVKVVKNAIPYPMNNWTMDANKDVQTYLIACLKWIQKNKNLLKRYASKFPKTSISESKKKKLKSFIQEVMNQSQPPVVQNIEANANYDEFLAKPENQGSPFTKNEFDTLDTLDSKPYKKDQKEIRYSGIESTSNQNKNLVIRKIKNRYVAFFSVRKPINVGEPDADQKIEDATDKIIIKISRPFTDGGEDASLLSNFIDSITREYQI